jgi:ABC-type uncharacterized transport system substrate-binding protein
MNKKLKQTLLTILFFVLLFTLLPTSSFGSETKVKPRKNNADKWRVALYQGGDYGDYSKILLATVKGLMALGWIETDQMPEGHGESTQKIWSWLSSGIKSEYIDFVSDGFYSADWDETLRENFKEKLLSRVKNKKDIDLILAVGTWAAQDVSSARIKVPAVGISISDPVASGIIKSVEDSGNDYFTTRVDPLRDEQQIRIFHDIVGFKCLGIPYEDSTEGRSYAAMNVIERLAKELDFEIVSEFTNETNVTSKEIAVESLKKALEKLIKTSDAIYIPVAPNGLTSESITEMVQITNSGGIPTFSQSGSHEVKKGFFMSISESDFKFVGEFNANTIARILNGAKPGELNQLFEAPPKIAINLKTAEVIGFDLPVDVLVAADEIYQGIETP